MPGYGDERRAKLRTKTGHDGAVSYRVGLVAEGSRVRGSVVAVPSCGDWFTQPEMRTRQDVMDLCLSSGNMRSMLPWQLRCVLVLALYKHYRKE